MWLIVQVDADHDVGVGVATRQHHPVVDPLLLANVIGIPQVRLGVGIRAMPVQDNLQTALARAFHHLSII